MRFMYMLSGWEGSASDSYIFEDAWRKGFTILEDRYYLADAGYVNSNALLVPYRGHVLPSSGVGNCDRAMCIYYFCSLCSIQSILSRLWNPRELFNYWHVQLRNVIEWIFGVMKKCFQVLLLLKEYPITMQVCLISALAALYNILWIYDPDDKIINEDYKPDGCDDSQMYSEGIECTLSTGNEEGLPSTEMTSWRWYGRTTWFNHAIDKSTFTFIPS